MEIARSLAGRKLRRLASYRDLTREPERAPDWAKGLALRAGEAVLGIYENVPGTMEGAIVVTNLGVHVRRDGRWEVIDYAKIEAVETPPEQDKHSVDALILHLSSGRETRIPVGGGKGRLRDVWVVLRFLGRASYEVRRERGLVA